MPYPSTFPLIIEDLFEINMAQFKDLVDFKEGNRIEGIYKCVKNWVNRGQIEFFLSINERCFIEFSGFWRGQYFEKTIQIDRIPSNLHRVNDGSKKKKWIYYFVCPSTGKHCRILYVVNGEILSRTAIKAFYRKQTLSKDDYYSMMALLNKKFERLTEEQLSPYFKNYYRGEPTKRVLRIEKELEKIRIERLKLSRIINGITEDMIRAIRAESGLD